MLSDLTGMAESSGGDERPIAAVSALACLAGKPLSSRFSAWRGASGCRYICTIYPVDRADPQGGLPPYRGMIVLAVRVGIDGHRDVVAVTEVDVGTETTAAPYVAGHEVADEFHVHLMAEAPDERATVLRDLLAR